MKIALFSLTIASAVLMSISCGVSKDDRSDALASRSGNMKKIYVALVSYKAEHGKIPDSLSILVSKGLLTAEDLIIRRVDGKLQRPEYFPNAQEGTAALLAFESDPEAGRIIINLDGSVRSKTKKPNKAQMATPSKPSD